MHHEFHEKANLIKANVVAFVSWLAAQLAMPDFHTHSGGSVD